MPLILPKLSVFESDLVQLAAKEEVDSLTAAAILLINDENALDADKKKYRATSVQGDQVTLKAFLAEGVFASIKDAIDIKLKDTLDKRQVLAPSSKYSVFTTPSLAMDLVCILLGRSDFSNSSWKGMIESMSEIFSFSTDEEKPAPKEVLRLVEGEDVILLNGFMQELNKELKSNNLHLTATQIRQIGRLLEGMSTTSIYFAYLSKQVKEYWLTFVPAMKKQYQQINDALNALSFYTAFPTDIEERLNNILEKLTHLVGGLSHKGWGEEVAQIIAPGSDKKEKFKEEYQKISQVVTHEEWKHLSNTIQKMQGRVIIQYGEQLEKDATAEKIKTLLNQMVQFIKPYVKVLPETYALLKDENRAISPSQSRSNEKVVPPLLLRKIEKAASSPPLRTKSPLSPRTQGASSSTSIEVEPASSVVSPRDTEQVAPLSPGLRKRSRSFLDKLKDNLH